MPTLKSSKTIVAARTGTPSLPRETDALQRVLASSPRISRRMEAMRDEVFVRLVAMEGEAELAEFADLLIARDHLRAQRTHLGVMYRMNQTVIAAESLDDQTFRDVQAWAAKQKQQYERHLSSRLEQTAARQNDYATRELYERRRQPTIWEKLLGLEDGR